MYEKKNKLKIEELKRRIKEIRKEKIRESEGRDIIHLLEKDIEDINDDELTKGRIRSIYAKLKYGSSTAYEIADYYGLPEELIKDIGRGKVFADITADMR